MSCFTYDFDWIPLTSIKEASNIAGLSVSALKVLAADGVIDTSKRDSKIDYVNNSSFSKFLAVNGGKQERYDEAVLHDTLKEKVSLIKSDYKAIKALYNVNIKEQFKKKPELKEEFDNNKFNLYDALTDITSAVDNEIVNLKNQTLNEIINTTELETAQKIFSSIAQVNPNHSNRQIEVWYNIIQEHTKNEKTLSYLVDVGFTDNQLETYYDKIIDINETFDNGSFKSLANADPEYKFGYFFKTYKSTKDKYESIAYVLDNAVTDEITEKYKKKFHI